MLQINSLVAGYRETKVINGIDLCLTKGEIIGITGRNGVGKTTLMKTIMGLINCKSGEILLEGQNISSLPSFVRANMGLGYVPQGRLIFPRLSVLDNLRVGSIAVNKDVNQKVEKTLEEFPILKTKLKARGGSLSGGQQQILAIARALMSSPKLILLDEPTEGIQPSIVEEIINKIKEINKRGISVLVVEQKLEYLCKLADKIHIMDMGKIAKEVTSTELINDKRLQHKYLGI